MRRGDAGFALVEAMIGAAIVAISLAAMYAAIYESASRNRMAEQRRTAMMIAQSELAAVGSISRAELSSYLGRAVARVPLERSPIWDEFVSVVCDFQLTEHHQRADGLCDARLVDPDSTSKEKTEAALSDPHPEEPAQIVPVWSDYEDLYTYRLVGDLLKETACWRCFERDGRG